ncbi:MAG: phage baseplate assembly protein V [Candidatus Bipolaricaulia bacterium]
MPDLEMEKLVVEAAEFMHSRYFGKYRGLVRDVDDPENLGRIIAQVPEVYGEEVDSPWALPSIPYSGDGEGQFMIPPIGAGVWIEFEAGDVSRPIWSGCWWGGGELPKDNSGTAATPPLKIIRSEKGLMVTLDDGSQTITLSDEKGSNMLTIKVQQGQITIQGAVKAVVEAPQIELVENAMHPVVFGDNLLQYLNLLVNLFNSHIHPGELAAGFIPVTPTTPVPPFPPATPSLLSMKVKSG